MRFCFFGNIAGAMKGQTPGGGELQMSLLVKALAQKGEEVIVIDPYLDKSFISPDGVKVMNVPNWNKGIKGLRMFMYRIPALWKVCAEVNADFYYVRMRSFLHILLYLVAKKKGKKFINAIAHDLDVSPIRNKIKYEYKTNFNLFSFLTEHLPNDLALKFLLQNSDYVTIQHTGQQFPSKGAKSRQILFPNIINTTNFPVVQHPSRDYYIHVGSFTLLKGAESLQQLINILSTNKRIMIIGQPKGEKALEIYNELRKRENVILKGRLSHQETIQHIANAKALISTSNFEGFPNIYLEAWGVGVPVISLNVNPGQIFNTYRLGVHCNGNLNRMKQAIETNETDQFDEAELKAYVKEFHDYKTAADRFLHAISLKTAE